MKINFRLGQRKDSKELSLLALRSKAYWPYDEQFVRDCAKDLEISEERAVGGFIVVAEMERQIIGFYGFSPNLNDPEMTHLFIEPGLIGKGVGIQLWNHAISFAKEKGLSAFKLIADPYAAENFYFRVGCKQAGEVESSVRPGRKLPILIFKLD